MVLPPSNLASTPMRSAVLVALEASAVSAVLEAHLVGEPAVAQVLKISCLRRFSEGAVAEPGMRDLRGAMTSRPFFRFLLWTPVKGRQGRSMSRQLWIVIRVKDLA